MLKMLMLGLLSLVWAEPEEAAAEPAKAAATWKFEDAEKPVKVVVLAGSVGAWTADPYHALLARQCKNIEVKNISEVGLGAYPMKVHFKHEVLRNRRLNLEEEGSEFWVLVTSGVNSIGMPKSTNHYLKSIFLLAHMAGMKVVALSPTPWGDLSDKRWRGTDGLSRRKATQLVVDFISKRISPAEAFGEHASKRPAGVDGPWNPIECPDVGIDMYDSGLRSKEAEPRDLEAMKAILAKDAGWTAEHRDLGEAERTAAADADAALLADLPRWFLREELRAFDHTHPNKAGHKVMADTICPQLPQSWGCVCE